ncbi:MAG TPA: acyl-CoA dehydrogenase, partial [Myxococcales bacterium]|nr:acyl-CoA dehydrogenase [Myxococcales bacterium]
MMTFTPTDAERAVQKLARKYAREKLATLADRHNLGHFPAEAMSDLAKRG